MRITARNLIPDYLAYTERAGDERSAGLASRWTDLYASKHPDVFDAYFAAGDPEPSGAAIAKVNRDSHLYADRADLLETTARALAPRVLNLFDVELDEVGFVFMVGLDRSDGWVDNLDGAPTIFHAVERFREPPWEQAHVVHELAHVAHIAVQAEPWDDEVVGLRLMLEGVAIEATHQLLPDVPEWAHFNRDPDEIDPLLAAYGSAAPDCAHRLQGLAQSSDPRELARFFFPDWWRTARDVPERVGYFVGWQAVRRLCERSTLSELARLSPHEAIRRARQALSDDRA